MSRYCGEVNSKPIFDSAVHWRDAALIGGGSVFTTKKLWTVDGLIELDRYFVQQPDTSNETFLRKLELQLRPTSEAAKQLAAEMFWLMYLCPSSLTPEHKRKTVRTIWSWSDDSLNMNSPYLADSVLGGIGSAGPGFNQNQWRELVFFINFLRQFRTLELTKMQQLLADAWAFDEWLTAIPDSGARQLRHMLLFLLFPDHFERIFGQSDRKAIARQFSRRDRKEINRMSPIELDRELLDIRRRLESERGTDQLDYYVTPLKNEWTRESNLEGTEANPIADLVERFLTQARLGTDLAVRGYISEYRGLKVQVSFGKGNFARIPWVAFLGEGQSVSHGIYPVLLFYAAQQQLLLCYGVSETSRPEQSWGELSGAISVREWFNQRNGRDPERYGDSLVADAYDATSVIPIVDLQHSLDNVIDKYAQMLASPYRPVPSIDRPKPTEHLPARANLQESASSFAAALRNAGVHFGRRHENIVQSFVASLATKPLVILTGLSGSGKTQIAIRFGEWLGHDRLHVCAVRPDWTGAEALFGYEDGLKPTLDGRAAWAVPAPMEFILKAASDPQHPYLLLLDEMNLAHVERYFADVLSGMESREPCLPNLELGSDGCWRCVKGATQRLPVPRNLWIVGTVNVDETTYMFSPKVLDRAQTFEFRVETSDLSVSGSKPTRCLAGDAALVRGLLSIAQNDGWHADHPAAFQEGLAVRMRQLHELLGRYNLEFGHRVFYESLRFAALVAQTGQLDHDSVLDLIVMQKVLPRLHGSRRRLELPLLALAQFCHYLPAEIATDEKLPTIGTDVIGGSEARLPVAHSKVSRMLRNLRANQFASFTE